MYNQFDIIFVLDACRYDYFEKVLPETNLKGELTKFNTGTSTTSEWYIKFWSEPTDFTLISGNPVPFHKNSKFAHKNFQKSEMSFVDSWQTVNPEKTIKMAVPHHKALIHLLPPHLPYVFGQGGKFMENLKGGNVYHKVQTWGQKNGFEKLREYYQEQVLGVLKLIETNLHLFNGKILITADHGELLGEQSQYDHPPNAGEWQEPYLYEVPFFEVNRDETLLDMRLSMLGYL